MPVNCSYLMPIRRSTFDNGEAGILRDYLAEVSSSASEIIVVDGSNPEVFDAHHELWASLCRHVQVDRRFGFLNDKVNGIQTGVRLATVDKIILADDDIRYSNAQIGEIAQMLERYQVVRPQNYFDFSKVASASSPMGHGLEARAALKPWALTEAARMLINRATLSTADYPGTCAFRRETMLRAGGYDGDVLFDNEELIRHLASSGASICYAHDFFIRKRPPTFRKWLEQRPRQAYEDFGLRAKTALFALLPLVVIGVGGVGAMIPMFFVLLTVALLVFILALTGRARGQARKFFPVRVCFFAPLWVLERTLSTYWAFYWFLRYGGYPFGGRLLQKGIGRDWVEGGRIASETVAGTGSPK